MITCHPLQAPWVAWNLLNNKKLALKCWIGLLRVPRICPWYRLDKFPWCGWKQFWQARPWINVVK